ncbi:Uncharacterized conserved protein YkwD, contains CAP (CSP/antigen 5/PR1) domain [Monaibacterium marinum]|uniref:Uncharacterized conserved protein YkwD, contains CAP (CSP/antigen 5/PR1) domain n=1 Tax=Pontivivens marinum TaxID=1690039 RepID=A0A2C9CQL8_9RHOB|nr:CAP domain-containing protein [Monaibacterium marinum]SOH93465.1 Uncharacterized conserved protein YkwD, contains CAP (CSP/antigen 5/PR1) domain [Monaibacterium marinum]
MFKTLTLLAALALPGAAIACPTAPLTPRAQAELPRDGSQDRSLFSLALAHYVNVERCANDLPPIAAIPALNAAADAHSRDMARLDFFDHMSPVAGRETLVDRLRATGVSLSLVAENLGQTFMVDYQTGRQYSIVDAAQCAFSYGPDTDLMARRTYDSAAQALVAGWMDSPPHRRNLLDPKITRHGAGFAVTQPDTLCGRIVATQVLIQ